MGCQISLSLISVWKSAKIELKVLDTTFLSRFKAEMGKIPVPFTEEYKNGS
jgi:hypothetical protein